MAKELDYPYIRAWHYTSGSFPYYVDAMVAKARQMNAPQDACFERVMPSGTHVEWVTVDMLGEPHKAENIREMHEWMEQHGVVIPEPA